MSKVSVVYWSQSGNTQAMAEAVGKGAADAGAEVSVVYVGDASVNDLKDGKAFALGCPAMGAEVLEESEMEPFVADVEGICGGKTVGLFGSYGWGDGQLYIKSFQMLLGKKYCFYDIKGNASILQEHRIPSKAHRWIWQL